MKYHTEVDSVTHQEWDACVLQFADFSIYQAWPYQEKRAEHDGQRLRRIVVTDSSGKACAVFQLRVKRVPWVGLTIGYVQWGPVLRRHDEEAQEDPELLHDFAQTLFDQGLDVLRIVPNCADLPEYSHLKEKLHLAGYSRAQDKQPYRTFLVDVSDSEEGIRKRLRKSFRRDLKNAEKLDTHIKVGTDEEKMKVLAGLYEERKTTKGFKGLSIEEFSTPQGQLIPEQRMKVFTAFHENKPASALLASELGDTSIVLLAASNEVGLDKGCSYLLWYQACVSAHHAGMKYCDLGGGDPKNNSSVYRFKSRLGGKEVSHIGAYDICKSKGTKLLWSMGQKAMGYRNHKDKACN